MQDPQAFPLPYLLRDMLRFEYGAKVELVVTTQAGAVYKVNIVGATREGLFKYEHTTVAGSLGKEERFSIPDIPIWVSAIGKDESIPRGDLYLYVNLAINKDNIHTLFSGYVSWKVSLTWPAVHTEASGPKGGRPTISSPANPAAGAEYLVLTSPKETWKILGIRFTLTTAAVVASRRVHVVFIANGAPYFECLSSVDQLISTTRQYTCMQTGGAGTFADDNDIIIPIPQDVILNENDSFGTSTTNLQAGDAFSAMDIIYDKFLVAA